MFLLVKWVPSCRIGQETLHLPHFFFFFSGSADFGLHFWVATLFKFLGWLKQTCMLSPIFFAFSFLTRHCFASLSHMLRGGLPALCVKIILILSSFIFLGFLFCWIRSSLGRFFAFLNLSQSNFQDNFCFSVLS